MNLHPAFTPDGKQLYFTSTRPDENGGKHGSDADIWFVERQGDSWSEPVRIGGTVNTENNESSPSPMADGTLYFDRIEIAGRRETGIYFSRRLNGAYQAAEKLPPPINSGNQDLGPFIFPDGSGLLFYSSRPGGLGEADLYVAFRKNDTAWSDPVHLGEKINSKFYDWAATVTPDGKYIVFSSSRNSGPDPIGVCPLPGCCAKSPGTTAGRIRNFLLGGCENNRATENGGGESECAAGQNGPTGKGGLEGSAAGFLDVGPILIRAPKTGGQQETLF